MLAHCPTHLPHELLQLPLGPQLKLALTVVDLDSPVAANQLGSFLVAK